MAIANLPNDLVERLDLLGLEPLRRFAFAAHFDGQLYGSQFIMGFQEITGLGGSVDVREVKEAGSKYTHIFPRTARSDTITLRRGMTASRAMWQWFNDVRNWEKGMPSYARTLTISLLLTIDPIGVGPVSFEVWKFDILDAWPSEWNGPSLNANTEDLAFESLVLHYSELTRAESYFNDDTAELVSLLQQR